MLRSFYHYNFSGYYRYPDDIYDRYWYPEGSNSTFLESTTPPPQILTTNHNISRNISENYLSPVVIPEAVIDTALTTTGGNITIIFPDAYGYNNQLPSAFVLFYYAELDATANATSRQFYLQAPDFTPIFFNPIVNASQFSAKYVGFEGGWSPIVLYQDQTIYSPLGPLVNALEVLELSENLITIITNHEDGELLFCLLSTGFLLLFKFSSENTSRHSTPRVSFLLGQVVNQNYYGNPSTLHPSKNSVLDFLRLTSMLFAIFPLRTENKTLVRLKLTSLKCIRTAKVESKWFYIYEPCWCMLPKQSPSSATFQNV